MTEQVPAYEIAMTLALSYGRDPDEPAPILEMCDENNQPVPIWMVYVEQAEALLAAYSIAKKVINPISQGMLRTQEIMRATDMEAKIAALAHRFWSIHPSSLDDMGLTREEFYASEMRKLLIPTPPQEAQETKGDLCDGK